MPEKIPPPFGLALTILRSAQGWSQKRLAAESGIAKTMISDFEVGRRPLSRDRLETLAAVLGYGAEDVDAALLCRERLRPAEDDDASSLRLTPAERRLVDATAALVAKTARDVTRSKLTRQLQVSRARKARQEAEALWERLRRHPPRDRRVLVEGAVEFQIWALCERLCAESEKAAAADANRALELADLALRVALLVPGEPGWCCRLQGYAWAHVGNARRVASNLPGADDAFATYRELWAAGGPGSAEPLDEGRVLDLEASLRRDQRRFPEALELHDRALTKTTPDASGYILLNKATTLEQSGYYDQAIETLHKAAPLIDRLRQARLLFALRFNLAVNLFYAERHRDAAALLPEIRKLAVGLGNELDLVRALWLEGRITSKVGRIEDAISILEQVRTEFAARNIAYDMALASLELAILRLTRNHTAEVKVLARQMMQIFQGQGVHRESLGALRLFCEAAERDTATVELAQRLIDYLERARHEPQLRFEA